MVNKRSPFGQSVKNPFEFLSSSVEETQNVASRLGRLLRGGDVLALHGELGSGKTTFIQGLAKGLGLSADVVKSPTFVLMREYPSRVASIVHLDGYRLEGATQVAWLDIELMFAPHKITLIEWAERFEGLLPEERVEVWIEHVSTNRRRIRLASSGQRSSNLLEQLRSDLGASTS